MGEVSVVTSESQLHAAIIRHVAEKGFAPKIEGLAKALAWSDTDVRSGLARLAEIRGVILKPNSFDVWAIHPFTLMPTATWVVAQTGAWWANCAWCALGIEAALGQNIHVSTRLGAESDVIAFEVCDGRSTKDDLLIHFPFPPSEWWSNPYNPCGCILFFSSESEIDVWCNRHGLPRGETIDIAKGIALARAWFGDYLELTWKRKSPDEAQQVFRSLGLNSTFWRGG
jgi:hypothetical protein